jgi:hypothetical protein
MGNESWGFYQQEDTGWNLLRWLAVILSRNSVRSPSVEREISAALVKELDLKDIFVLPVLYEECEIPLFFAG